RLPIALPRVLTVASSGHGRAILLSARRPRQNDRLPSSQVDGHFSPACESFHEVRRARDPAGTMAGMRPDDSTRRQPPEGLGGDVARLFSSRGTIQVRPTVAQALERVATRPGPQALFLYRASRWLWPRCLEFPAERLWRLNYLPTGADNPPRAAIGRALRPHRPQLATQGPPEELYVALRFL